MVRSATFEGDALPASVFRCCAPPSGSNPRLLSFWRRPPVASPKRLDLGCSPRPAPRVFD
eukprot:1893805-Pyramimonas_sp.AAC.1